MPDQEKVIKDLEECLSASCRGFRPRLSCPYNDEEWNIMRDALALLKEQEAEISRVSNEYLALVGKASKKPTVVRCRDCKYRFVDGESVRFNVCLLNHNKVQSDDWFCADGERKEGR